MARVGQRKVFDRAVVGDVEREHLARGVGAELRAARLAGGWSQRRLATAAGCAPTTVGRIEAGTRRPRRSLLASLTAVLDPDGRDGLLGMLVDAAGDSLAAETTAGSRRRKRRIRAAGVRRRREARRAEEKLRQADALIRHAERSTNAILRGHTTASFAASVAMVQQTYRDAQALRAEATAILSRLGSPSPRPIPVHASVRTGTFAPEKRAHVRQAAPQHTQ